MGKQKTQSFSIAEKENVGAERYNLGEEILKGFSKYHFNHIIYFTFTAKFEEFEELFFS